MQTMPDALSLRDGKSVPMGALLALGGGLALYQVSSLVLGPAGSRQLSLSLSLPAPTMEEPADVVTSNINLVLGTLVATPPTAAVPAGHPTVASTPHRAAQRAAAPGSSASNASAPVVVPESKTAPHPPASRPTPPTQPTQPTPASIGD